ncbi:hypothetical protein DL96DRAFT_1565090 [Flagelloscypha sp. PMI_526]|nr:hypothetical protein DL96DRAFT_1565090 [Flagelloscypha sp. PMI_526]
MVDDYHVPGHPVLARGDTLTDSKSWRGKYCSRRSNKWGHIERLREESVERRSRNMGLNGEMRRGTCESDETGGFEFVRMGELVWGLMRMGQNVGLSDDQMGGRGDGIRGTHGTAEAQPRLKWKRDKRAG